MTNVNKINAKQKEEMAEFMKDHPNLAKNVIPYSAQGKTVAKRLWEELSNRLNSYGPPVKNVVAWRKVYADQKHNIKKKLSFNKHSQSKTGGGPYEEMLLSPSEEQIIQAAGIEAAVEGIPSVKTFGIPNTPKETDANVEEQNLKIFLDDECTITSEEFEKETPKVKKVNCKAETKLNLLMSNLSTNEKFYCQLNSKLDRLIEIKEKSLKLKEEEHIATMAIKKIELQKITIELENLK